MNEELRNNLFLDAERVRMDIARVLFSPQARVSPVGNARRLAGLVAELAAISARMEELR